MSVLGFVYEMLISAYLTKKLINVKLLKQYYKNLLYYLKDFRKHFLVYLFMSLKFYF